LIKNLAGVFSGLRQRAMMRRINTILSGGLNWAIGQRTEEAVYDFNKLVTKFAARLRIKIKIHKSPDNYKKAEAGLSGLSGTSINL